MATYYVTRDECINEGTHLVAVDELDCCLDCGYH